MKKKTLNLLLATNFLILPYCAPLFAQAFPEGNLGTSIESTYNRADENAKVLKLSSFFSARNRSVSDLLTFEHSVKVAESSGNPSYNYMPDDFWISFNFNRAISKNGQIEVLDKDFVPLSLGSFADVYKRWTISSYRFLLAILADERLDTFRRKELSVEVCLHHGNRISYYVPAYSALSVGCKEVNVNDLLAKFKTLKAGESLPVAKFDDRDLSEASVRLLRQ